MTETIDFDVKPDNPEPTALANRQPSTMDMLNYALTHEGSVDVIERFMVLHQQDQERKAVREFNAKLASCQEEIPRIVPDLNNPNSKKKYASYEALDKAIRPVYLKHGFSLSFGTADSPNPEKVRTICRVSHVGGHTQVYQIDITADGSGPKGGGVLTRPHADLAANTLGIRRLLRMIFNIVDEAEDQLLTNGWLMAKLEDIEKAPNAQELEAIFREAYSKLKEEKNWTGIGVLVEARDKKRKACKW